jgi:hypothetical protein
MTQLKHSEKLYALMARKAAELGGRRLRRDEWIAVADQFFFDLQKQRARATTHPDAEAIYANYPRKVAKDAALRAISAAIDRKNGEVAGLLESTQAYARAVETWPKAVRFKRGQTGDTFDTVPHPATWFNEGRFDDERSNWPIYGATTKKLVSPAQHEPLRWREYLEADMPDCVYLQEQTPWAQIDADLREHITAKMRAKGFL